VLDWYIENDGIKLIKLSSDRFIHITSSLSTCSSAVAQRLIHNFRVKGRLASKQVEQVLLNHGTLKAEFLCLYLSNEFSLEKPPKPFVFKRFQDEYR